MLAIPRRAAHFAIAKPALVGVAVVEYAAIFTVFALACGAFVLSKQAAAHVQRIGEGLAAAQ
jgi:hypothetical protein